MDRQERYAVYHATDLLAMVAPQAERWYSDRSNYFTHVADMEAPLARVFALTNHIDHPWTSNPEVVWYSTAEAVRSTSVGDVIVSQESGQAWLVMPFGLQELSPENELGTGGQRERRHTPATHGRTGGPLMTTTAIRGSGATTLLDGSWPLRPFHPDGFVGTLQADGQQVRVAALACDDERVVVLSLVGFDTSIGVVLARLWSSTAVPFAPAPEWQEAWSRPELLKRSGERYKQCVAHLEGTREVHALALVRTAHLTEGILHPPDLPDMQERPGATTVNPERAQPHTPPQPAGQPKQPVWVPRYVLGNWDESGPHQQSFLGHLYALRVLFLHRDEQHPEWSTVWAEALWERGLENRLITPLEASGMRAWKLSGDLLAWSALVGEGVREGWLPWKEPEPR